MRLCKTNIRVNWTILLFICDKKLIIGNNATFYFHLDSTYSECVRYSYNDGNATRRYCFGNVFYFVYVRNGRKI